MLRGPNNVRIAAVNFILSTKYHDEHLELTKNSSLHLSATTSKNKFTVLTITGQSYESKISRLKVYRCGSPGVFMPQSANIRWNNKYWQSPKEGGLFLYSAYYDARIRQLYKDRHCFIRILAMHDGNVDQSYYCQIWITSVTRPIVIDAEFTEIWSPEWDSQSQKRIYKPYIISCTIPRKFSKLNGVPQIRVSIVAKPCVNSTTLLEVKGHLSVNNNNNNSSTDRTSFVICVKPLDFDADFSSRLVEWIELNFILGASKIDIYKFRVHPDVEKVLSFYEKHGKINVISMTLPGNQPNFPIERTQYLSRNLWQKRRDELIPYNDCLYRNIGIHDFVIPLDVDEILIPRKHKTWKEMFNYLQKIDRVKLKSFASFSVRNAYYFETVLRNSGNNRQLANTTDLYFLQHLERSANFSSPGKSVKSFVRTDKALSVFNHYVLESAISGVGRNTMLPVDLIQMNHYRKKCPPTMSKECNTNFLKYKVQDDVVRKYEKELKQTVFRILTSIKNSKH